MGISIEVMPGEFWNVPISKAPGACPVTVRQLLSDIYRVLIEDNITISLKKLPLHLYHRIEQRASLRMRKMAKPATGAVQPVVLPTRKPERPRTKSKFSEILSKEEMQRKRRNRQKIPPAFKRIDILGATTCVGIEHRISDTGEDDWKVYFSN
ncbi:hypothetical protein D9619_007639 [Psilocybe cf. subviscida]|uniref:Uncharacterized protein n=1 Tax=Psilocybe cf. subviscida TaxID=2480587 RepID=A0A8H5ESV5_9AGAR|nr:hypothetical protein D9619_007639 [Psilocybe cf. subviscida]